MATTVPSGDMKIIFVALAYLGVPAVLRSSPEQSHYLPEALLPGDV